MWNPKEGVAMLGAFIGIKDGIEAILARDGLPLRSVLSSKSSAQSQARIVGISRLSRLPIVNWSPIVWIGNRIPRFTRDEES